MVVGASLVWTGVVGVPVDEEADCEAGWRVVGAERDGANATEARIIRNEEKNILIRTGLENRVSAKQSLDWSRISC